ncbi:SipW-dependent-type signal peptide-containing protein [Leifsonia sp. NPDC058292]|uniref:SipW-dependent-type signal peptide-containing protein n=1 Tax=Leifsonia sp. NPDC058292 TaxID=3346428 RepID=UPI0036D8DBD9
MTHTDAVTGAPPESGRRRGFRSRRVKAILAGGLVLGVGAAVTLAAWNDSEFAQGTFTAGTFNLVGSTDGTTFTDHATAGTPATLGFTVNAASLSPGAVTTAPFAVELAANTTNDAVVTVSGAGSTGTVAQLTYELLQTTTFGCTTSTTGTTVVPAGTALTTVPASTTFPLVHGTGGAAGAPVFLCYKVTAGAGLVQGQTGSATWQFAAASQ